MRDNTGFGDRAGEHLRMRRGKYGATAYVVLAYLEVAVLLGLVPFLGTALALEPPWSQPLISPPDLRFSILAWSAGGSAILGLLAAWAIFRDRWRCIEAFSSRYCSGVMNLTLIYLPTIAAIYACVRGARKLTTAERSPSVVAAPAAQPGPSASAALRRLKGHGAAPAAASVRAEAVGGSSPESTDRLRSLPKWAIAVIALAAVGAVVALTTARVSRWQGTKAASSSRCPGGEAYCSQPFPIAGAETGVQLEAAEVAISPREARLLAGGRLTHQGATELEELTVLVRLLDADGREVGRVPVQVLQRFQPPLRAGDSQAFHISEAIPHLARRGELVAQTRHTVPAPSVYGSLPQWPVELLPGTPAHFEVTAQLRTQERHNLGARSSCDMVVAVENQGDGVIRSLELKLIPLDASGREMKPTYAETVVWPHMPPMLPGERRVAKLHYYVTGQMATERIVATAVQ